MSRLLGAADHVGDLLLDQLELADLLAEGAAFERVGNGEVDAALRLADAARRHREASHVERRAEDREALARLAEHRVVGHEGVLEVHLGEVVALERAHREVADRDAAGRVRIDQERRHAAVLLLAVDRRHHEEEPRVRGVRDEDLGAGEAPAAVGARRGGGHVAEVGAAAGLGETRGGEQIAARDRAEPALLLRRRAVAEDRAGHERVGDRDHRRDHPVDARDLLADQPVGHHVDERAAVLLGNHRREVAERDELADQLGRVAGLALVAPRRGAGSPSRRSRGRRGAPRAAPRVRSKSIMASRARVTAALRGPLQGGAERSLDAAGRLP